ncbi:DUF4007 family protein [Paenibacillus planticolens]|uniref:DUF4007 family protein n=1 Tax=Paenibacillus planticolens TaxID=2654976 RepID=A0ABX1ZHK0_9BACL|nr:DUF4007 family protein [Paenibacillus planticolens]NOU99525.1 DUF4007 family protein [Paenibacillus planticolens]
MGYGQHQSFYLRPNWMSKMIRSLKEDPRFFYDDAAFEKVGLGKNMIKSARYWTISMKIAEEGRNLEKKTVHQLTEFASIFYQYDRFIRYPETASLLHYHLVSNREPATTWYWFFNIVGENAISINELKNSLKNWVMQNESKTVSDNSLKRDIDCLILLYTSGSKKDSDPEEVIQSPIQQLQLLSEREGIIYKNSPTIEEIGLPALMYCLLDYGKINNIDSLSVEQIQHLPGLWGRVFNFKRNNIVSALELLTQHPKYPIRFVRTNRIDTIRWPEITPLEYLKNEYASKEV